MKNLIRVGLITICAAIMAALLSFFFDWPAAAHLSAHVLAAGLFMTLTGVIIYLIKYNEK